MEIAELRHATLTGTIPSGIADSGATATCTTTHAPLQHTNTPSNKTFVTPTGDSAEATTVAKLHHNLREPARTAHVVPGVNTTLLST